MLGIHAGRIGELIAGLLELAIVVFLIFEFG